MHAAGRPVRGRLPAIAHRDVVSSALCADAGLQEAAAVQKRAAAEKLYAVHECTNQCMYKDTDTPTGNNLFLCNPSDGANKAAQVICERYALGENYGCAAAP